MRGAVGVARGLVLTWLSALVACSVPVEDAPPDAPFIALDRDFADFEDWPRFEIPDVGTTSGHDPGEPRFVYVRDEVPPWGEPFPVGAMIIKTLELGPSSAWEVHGMVKRGAGYNSLGAPGWEWFDLRMEPTGPVIAWRGEGSAADPGGYVTVGPDEGCNSCHAVVAGSDYVFTRAVFTPDPAAP